MAKKAKIINMKTKAAKYFVNHNLKGMPKVEAAKKAGITTVNNVTNMERTDTYKALQEKYADSIQKVIGMDEVAVEHVKNIVQDQDKGAKNAAIKMFLERVEPEAQQAEEDDKMIVILRE